MFAVGGYARCTEHSFTTRGDWSLSISNTNVDSLHLRFQKNDWGVLVRNQTILNFEQTYRMNVLLFEKEDY